MELSQKVFYIGGLMGALPLIGGWLNIPEGPWVLVNPIGLLLMILSGRIEFHEKYDIVPREAEN